ncbi:MAG: hypothetical protein WCH11_01175, partial [Bdellovibrio sp.]
SSLSPVSARDPAAIRRMYDFSNLQGSALQTALQTRLIDAAQVVARDDQKGIELGHFVVLNEKGEKVFACQKYSQVVMNFEAVGIAVAGAKPEMEVEGPCEMSENINKISPIWIPLARVLGEPVSDGEFDFMEGQKIRLRFKSVSDSWPKNWDLKNVRLVSKTGEVVEVPSELLRDRKNLSLSF